MARPRSSMLEGLGSSMQVIKTLTDGVLDRGAQDPEDKVRRILRERAVADRICDELMAIERRVFVTPLHDTQVADSLKEMAAAWRALASEIDYRGFTAYEVVAGFRFKVDAPKTGLCYQRWVGLEGYQLRNDEPTVHCTVFWVPRVLPGSTGKDVDGQLKLMAVTRDKFRLPAHHLTSFGSAALQSLLILDHARRTGERTPLDCYWIRTDTLDAIGNLYLGDFSDEGLCNDSGNVGGVGSNLGVLPLGVEVLKA